jgi:hypothetical protein
MKLQIETCPPSVWRNCQSKLVRRLPAFRVAGPYGGILHRRHCESAAGGRGNLPILPFTFLLFTFLAATFSAPVLSAVEGFADGPIIGWGEQRVNSTELLTNDFIAIAAGYWHSLALRSDGTIVGWGSNDFGQATPPAGNNYIAIAAGEWHSLALRSDGTIVGWGNNDYGQATPPAGNNYIAIAAGRYHSLAIKKVCQYKLTGDLNDDCRVNLYDFASMAANWLIDCDIDPNNPACIPK